MGGGGSEGRGLIREIEQGAAAKKIPPPFGPGMTRIGEFRGSHSMPANCHPMSLGQQKVGTVELHLPFPRSNYACHSDGRITLVIPDDRITLVIPTPNGGGICDTTMLGLSQ
jgi:hypothetical protein